MQPPPPPPPPPAACRPPPPPPVAGRRRRRRRRAAAAAAGDRAAAPRGRRRGVTQRPTPSIISVAGCSSLDRCTAAYSSARFGRCRTSGAMSIYGEAPSGGEQTLRKPTTTQQLEKHLPTPASKLCALVASALIIVSIIQAASSSDNHCVSPPPPPPQLPPTGNNQHPPNHQHDGYLPLSFSNLCPVHVFNQPLNTPGAHEALARISTSLDTTGTVAVPNTNSPVAICDPTTHSQTQTTIAVFPVHLHFANAECFCRDLGGHLASITNQQEYDALVTAALVSGSRSAIFIGAHELSEGQWVYSDETTRADGRFLTSKGWCAESRAEGIDVSSYHDCCSTCDNGIAGNSGGNEDTIAYCNDACIQSLGALDYMRPGFHDWGNSVAQDTLALPACMFLGNNPPLADSVPRTRCQ
jgi:hypothetical protein